VVVTAPDGPLQHQAGGSIVVLGPADVDGPWAALTAFALVPAGLVGADVRAVLADAAAAQESLTADTEENPALGLGALLATSPVVALADDGTPALAEWAAQLIGGGLGKDGHGPLAVPVEGPESPEWHGGAAQALSIGHVPGAAAGSAGSPAEQILLWQYAVAVAAHLLGVDPTDRPDATTPDAGPEQLATSETPAFVDGGIEAHAGPWLPVGTSTVAEALRALTESSGTHITVHAYLDRLDDASAAVLRPELARRTGLPTLFGWAPRCLPGSGQREKGGPPGALVCQLTGAADDGFDPGPAEPGADPLAEHQLAQARADASALAARGTTVLRLHFTDRVAGLVTLARAVQQL
jgi:glucose-6-phosphate isomerase